MSKFGFMIWPGNWASPTKELIDLSKRKGNKVKSHSSSLERDFADLIAINHFSTRAKNRRSRHSAGGIRPVRKGQYRRPRLLPSP